MIHSGSRGLGGIINDEYTKIAKKFEGWYFSNVRGSDLRLPYLPWESEEGHDYYMDQKYAVEFAKCSRFLMMKRIQDIIGEVYPEVKYDEILDTPHNYVSREIIDGEITIIHRKGAASAKEGELGIIPGSQGTGSYIVRGLGNPMSYCSSSHGAGRKLSRTQAVETLSLETEIQKLEDLGIIHAIRGKYDLEEAAGAYKDISVVLSREEDLVTPILKLSPVAVIKG